MNSHSAFHLVLLIALCGTVAAEEHTLTRTTLEDKIRGGWVGQMVGVAYGEPTEFRWLQRTVEGPIEWKPDMVGSAINQDDLYVEMTFAAVMDTFGIDATTQQFGEAFRDSKYALWHANAAARRHLNNGIPAPMSGHPRYNIHANDIDFQIESDFIGLMCPGLPRTAIDLCERVGRVMNSGDGLYGGMFVSGMYAAAFFESDVEAIVHAGLACIPEESSYYKTIADTLAAHDKHPKDWQACWRAVNNKWDRHESCPEGAFAPFNIDARINGAYIAIGLLYGNGDFARTIEISTRCGQDSDCNPSNAAGILAVTKGYRNLPHTWIAAVDKFADEKFAFTNFSLNEIVDSTLTRAEQAIINAGGEIAGDTITIRPQTPIAPVLEKWSMGVPKEIVKPRDNAWTWHGAWADENGNPLGDEQVSHQGGDEAELRFVGSAIALMGYIEPEQGGAIDVYLDGIEVAHVNSYLPADTSDVDLWHAYGMRDGPHTLRIVTRDDVDPRSKGKVIRINHAQIFSPEETAD